jgi:hypothetical protein
MGMPASTRLSDDGNSLSFDLPIWCSAFGVRVSGQRVSARNSQVGLVRLQHGASGSSSQATGALALGQVETLLTERALALHVFRRGRRRSRHRRS